MTGSAACSAASARATSGQGMGYAFRSQRTRSTPPRRATSSPRSERLALTTWANIGGPESKLPSAATNSGWRSMTNVAIECGNGITAFPASTDGAGTTTTLGTLLAQCADGNGIVVLLPKTPPRPGRDSGSTCLSGSPGRRGSSLSATDRPFGPSLNTFLSSRIVPTPGNPQDRMWSACLGSTGTCVENPTCFDSETRRMRVTSRRFDRYAIGDTREIPSPDRSSPAGLLRMPGALVGGGHVGRGGL